VQVGKHIPEDPVKPCDEIFIMRQARGGLEGAQEAFLHDVGGHMVVAEAFAGEGLESAEVGEQGGDEGFLDWCFGNRSIHSILANAASRFRLQANAIIPFSFA
jgi:hypothetical protein